MKKITLLKNRLVLLSILLSTTAFGQTQEDIRLIQKETNTEVLNKMAKEFAIQENEELSAARAYAKLNGIPLEIKSKDGKTYATLIRMEGRKPIYYGTSNVAAAKSTRANYMHNSGGLGLNVEGQNMTAYVWDAGIANVSHQEYDGIGGNNRYSAGENTTTHNHAAHVAGTIIASGYSASAKGMAPQSSAIGYNWTSDHSEATNAAANGMLLSNHSYGYRLRDNNNNVLLPTYYFGGYIYNSYKWDQIQYNAPYYLQVVSAGNNGNDNTANTAPLNGNSNFDKLSGQATAKNTLVVANAQDANIDANGNLISATINSSSSEGPTDDLRIKPDITGNGTGVRSTLVGSSSYAYYTGTSMSSPNVTGSLLLLQQYYKSKTNSFMKAATLKGLALHTADDLGATGPDAIYGWGHLNTKKCAETIAVKDSLAYIQELTLNNGDSMVFIVNASGAENLMASISWTDKPGSTSTVVNNSTPVLVHDLDIRIKKDGVTHLPYKLTSPTSNALMDNNVDPFERISVAGASGTYTIVIKHKGTLSSPQNFSFIVTGVTIPQQLVCTVNTPSNIAISNITTNQAIVSWDSIADPTNEITYDLRYRILGSNSSWSSVAINSGMTYTLSGLSSSTNYEVQVRANCPTASSSYSSSTNFTTDTPPDTQAPTIPTNLTVLSITMTTATASWNASTDNIAVTAYEISLNGTVVGTVSGTTFNLTGLSALTAYALLVNTNEAAGNNSADTHDARGKNKKK
ncbi:MAG: S8 family serine peptidase, partial [Flavobacteriales bacterium]|nr:S8 family serine peptidase [Flavobacteriales bacterium]